MGGQQPTNESLTFAIWDFAPDGLGHISPEIKRAHLTGIYQPTPPQPCHFEHCHPEIDVTILTHGSSLHIIGDDQPLEFGAGEIEVIPSGVPHRFSPGGDIHVGGYGICIPPSFFRTLRLPPDLQPLADRMAQTTNPLPVRVVSDPMIYLAMKNLFEEMMMVHREADDPCNARILEHYNEIFALYVLKIMRSDSTKFQEHPSLECVLEVKTWLDRNFFEPVTLAQMAQMAALSQQHFSHLFHKVTGVSPKAYLLTRRLEHAAFLLINSSLSITNIAQNVGFNTLTNFTCAFTKYSGLTPSDYRKTPPPRPELSDGETPREFSVPYTAAAECPRRL